MSISDMATEALTHFTRGEREADGIGPIFILKDASVTNWVQRMAMDAHKDGSPSPMLPDDWRYEFISDVLSCLAEEKDNLDEAAERFREWFDGAYIYTHQKTAWLASRNDRMGYVDQARETWGDSYSMDTNTSLGMGMLEEAQEVWASVVSSLEAEVESREDATP